MPRAGLDATRVVDEATLVADAVGIDNLSLAEVATRLGVKVPSLYKHIGGLEDVRHQVSIRAREALAGELIGIQSPTMLSVAQAYLNWARLHPGLYPATLRAPRADDAADIATSASAVEVIYRVLADLGLEGEAAIDATRMLRATLHGYVTLEAAGGFGIPRELDRSLVAAIVALEVAVRSWPT